ncbi:hypothetical protein AYO20_03599 [Fonsecaea nubica]|uniref:Uncharacterized protein n=1 Tax=Fonsecaea nubica TaxID=856822 RepID=A0A178D7D6_9EURO|nr:hypothetical protein AYO20_03599 [Fonsecaea nubica]OAL37121.1 hypothetical protein AYO20_03599 [Fonsecaea nubica]
MENTWSIHKLVGRIITGGTKKTQDGQQAAGEYQRLATDHDSPIDNDDERATIEQSHVHDKAGEAGGLEEIEDAVSLPPPPRRRGPRLAQLWLLLGALIATILLLVTAVTTIRHIKPPSPDGSLKPPKLGLHCGSSLAEARANGCEFDLLSYSWTPSACYDRVTDLEFREWVHRPERQFGAFPFFLDRQGTAHITDEEALSFRAGSLARTTQEEHLGHCIFWMRRVERILEGANGGRFAERGDGMPHTLHCSENLLARLEGPNPKDRDELHAVIAIGYNTC